MKQLKMRNIHLKKNKEFERIPFLFHILYWRNNLKINAIELGKGEPILLLHGWGGNLMLMLPIASSLSHDYRCIALDLFGFGKTDEIENYTSFNDYIESLHEYLDSINVFNPIIIAHSFGARIAVLYALKYQVRALVLTGAAGLKKPLSLEKKFKIFLHKRGFKQKGSNDYENASVFLKKVLIEVVNTDLTEQYSQIKLPTLLIWGELDIETPLWMAKKLNQFIQNSQLIIFKNEDHFAYYHECERFCFIVKEFLLENSL